MPIEPIKHSKVYSPSKSSIWLNCPLSTKFNVGSSDEEPNQASVFGTECHELGAALICKSLKIEDYDNTPKPIDELIKELFQ